MHVDLLAASGRSMLFSDRRHQHRHRSAIVGVFRVRIRQVMLLQLDGDENVDRRDDREEQVHHGHGRRRPEGKEPAHVERVAYQPVGPRCFKLEVRIGFALQV